ncbi:MAG: transcription-repair coupling factor [Clostridia bacterium]|nr:transcription-repair coupling factor [Clostridia bacterium]
MSVLLHLLDTLPAFRSLTADVGQGKLPATVTGLSHIHKVLLAGALRQSTGRCLLLLTADEAEAARLSEDLCAVGLQALLFPARDFSLQGTVYSSREYEQTRLGVLAQLLAGDYDAVVATVGAAGQFTLPPELLRQRTLRLQAGTALPVPDLPAALTAAGYRRYEQVDGPGQFAVRGGIVDVCSARYPEPIRIELWGDTVDTLCFFDPLTQRRTDAAETLFLPPASELLVEDPAALAAALRRTADAQRDQDAPAVLRLRDDAARLDAGETLSCPDAYLPLLYPEGNTLFDYMADALLLPSEWNRLRERQKAADALWQQETGELLLQGQLCRQLTRCNLDWSDTAARLAAGDTVCLEAFARTSDFPLRGLYTVNGAQLPVWSGSLPLLCDDLQDLLARGTACLVLAGREEKAARVLAEDLCRHGLPARFAADPPAPLPGQVLVLPGGLSAGAAFAEAGTAVITHGYLTGARTPRRRAKADRRAQIHSLAELSPGDYIVHVTHGIGIYQGVVQLELQGVIKDYIKLQYDKGDVLYVPVTQMDLVSKYIGTKEDVTLKLHRLGGQEWQKTKARVRSAVRDMAAELVKLYAARMATPGFAFDPDTEWQLDFERHFPFEETEDQLRCTEEIKGDMERPVPMDRLLCGDVGFGKTEVALRAAFKCVSQGKQCVMLVPTTILAYQHYQTILQRFGDFPVKVEMLSRFRTPKQQQTILKQLERGEVDIVVGTHRLLSQDVRLRDPGLFILDEEQRFGVAQKERIKQLFPGIDVLTLTATPIPRTLNMAMSGIRDMSVIEEAPQDRRPVQTFVMEQDNLLLAEAIRRELHRGGQVYYLHNRVESIEQCAIGLHYRIPEARVAFAHGKMSEEQLSDIWRQVLEHEVDILVCTTIIETGVDIPNVNTLIIENADRFGLSQLHQLRGRVGRSARRAFAYLTFTRGKALSDVAAKRLEAMRAFTEFGAGFKIALRDMEIRGAGNLLGTQQHGHMEAVGYDMYLRLLADAVEEEKGRKPAVRQEDCTIDLPISAHIPEDYIPSSAHRLEMYRRIADIRTQEDSLDVYDELIDRFGEPPAEVQGLIDVALLRHMAVQCGVTDVRQQGENLLLYTGTPDMRKGARLSGEMPGRVKINAGAKPYYAVRLPKKAFPLDVLRQVLDLLCAPEPDTADGKCG